MAKVGLESLRILLNRILSLLMVRVLRTHVEEFPLRTFREKMGKECSETRSEFGEACILFFSYVLQNKIKIIISEILHVLNELRMNGTIFGSSCLLETFGMSFPLGNSVYYVLLTGNFLARPCVMSW